ncbi:hypothetical protein H2198_010896 [Neophaeococcomyces mojaviensis]|uniref:Uncharacterized protein n=1 Tax=Neophaeococcomyces mojaviensis TaxID=3383035 RepID=A0ACC2ZNS1_9EURO|nr:hypothetical protein H2198_010896 [Knufia sp. JES_112]
MASSPAASDASHESDNEAQTSGASKAQGSKDKECQFCHQKFTSSSLGRHLDQFISKKKPDGIHDVDEIRRLRAGITRRTARNKKGEFSTDHSETHDKSAHPSPAQASSDVPTPAFLESLNKSAAGTNNLSFNRLGWQSTGVITDPPGLSTSGAPVASPLLTAGLNSSSANGLAGSKRSFSAYAADIPSSAAETARALELSLREVLDAISSATKRGTPLPEPFPFDITTRTFPSLVVALLPAPATLFQSSPFSTPTTIPLKPPGPEHLQTLRQVIRDTLDHWKWDALGHVQRNSLQNGVNISEEAANLTQRTQTHIENGLLHLDTAYAFYTSLSPEQQYQQWSIELLRAFKTEQDKLKEANERIARITQEASQLQQQIDYLSRCQWPREMAQWPPKRNTFSSAVQKELATSAGVNTFDAVARNLNSATAFNTSGGNDKWDFDKLVNKWKRHVREDRARRGAPTPMSNSMLPPGTNAQEHQNTNDMSRTSTPLSSVANATTRKSASDAAATMNGGHHSQTNSPTARNFRPPDGLSLNTNSAPTPTMHRPFAGTASRTQTPSQSNVQIISDAEEHFSRFIPYLKQKELEERQARNGFGD